MKWKTVPQWLVPLSRPVRSELDAPSTSTAGSMNCWAPPVLRGENSTAPKFKTLPPPLSFGRVKRKAFGEVSDIGNGAGGLPKRRKLRKARNVTQ